MKLPDNYCLIRADGKPKDNLRAAYTAACEQDGFDAKEGAFDMFQRTGRWLYAYIDELTKIEREIFYENSLPDLTAQQATILFCITCALIEADKVKADLVNMLCEFGAKKWGPD